MANRVNDSGLNTGTNKKLLYAEAEEKAAKAAAAAGAVGSGAGILAGMGIGRNTTAPQPRPTQEPTLTDGNDGSKDGGYKVTYIDANGDAKKGTTAETPSETTEEPQRTYLDDMRDQYQKMYDDAVKANDAAARAAAERAQAQVNEGIGSLGDSYGNLNKQLYRDYMESLRVLPQEMAARGYSGGMSESARLGLDTAYGERLNENEAARIAAEAELRQQAADAEYQANAARDQANAEAQQNLYANFMNLLLQQQNDAAQRAQNMAQYGDFSGYKNLGYTQDQIDQMQKAWIAANPELAKTLGYVKETEPVYGYYRGSGSGQGNVSGSDRGQDIASYYEKVNDLLANGATLAEIQAALAKEAKVNKSLTEDQAGDVMLYANYAKRIAPTIGDNNPSLNSFNQYRKQYI